MTVLLVAAGLVWGFSRQKTPPAGSSMETNDKGSYAYYVNSDAEHVTETVRDINFYGSK